MADSGRQIGFEQVGIGSVLSRNILSVPVNQREYSWTDREVNDLFHDLNKAISENAPEYFLGTIVTIPKKAGALEVVDGQQRLATTVILMTAIREALKGRLTDSLIVEHIENTFLSAIDPGARKRVPRLTLNVTDGMFFEARVLNGDLNTKAMTPSHRLIEDAIKFAADHISNILKAFKEKDYGDALNQWMDFLEHRAIVILLKVPTDVNAYKMFETLNDRGLRTSQSDLVKNYLFGQCGNRLTEAQQKWASMKARLESVSDEDITIDFLRQILISLYSHLRDADIYDTVQRKARGTTLSLQFMTILESGAADFAAMLNSDHEKWNGYPPSVRRAIKTLIVLPVKPMRPLILSIIRTFVPKEADLAFRALVCISARFLIVGGGRSGVVEERIAEAAKEVSDGKISNTAQLLKFLRKIAPKDALFEEKFKTATVSQAYLARYYLRSLESAVKKEADPYFWLIDDPQVNNLEHVLPENPEENWPLFTPEVAAVFYKRLGNMALLRAKKNSDLRSATFTVKKKAYEGSSYELTSQISKVKEWTSESIAQRQAKMAEWAVKTWPAKIA